MNSISSQLPLPKGMEAVEPGKAASVAQEPGRVHVAKEVEKPENRADHQADSTTEELVAMIQEHLNSLNINVTFSTYGDVRERTAVVVSERNSGDIIREFPPEELQNLYMKMDELVGMIFSGQA